MAFWVADYGDKTLVGTTSRVFFFCNFALTDRYEIQVLHVYK